MRDLRSKHPLKLVWHWLTRLGKQVLAFPQSIALAAQEKRRQSVLNELEAERIDRICNPSKYLGK